MTGTKKQSSYSSSEQEYRKISGLNCSMLKVYDEDPGIFYQEFILGSPRKEKESSALTIGSIVDFILLDCNGNMSEFEQRMGEKFGMFSGVRSTAQAFDLADELFKITIRDVGEDGVVRSSLEDRMKEALLILQEKEKYKGKTWEKDKGKIAEDFNKTAGEYFKSKLENVGKTIVDSWQLEKAKSIVQQAQGDEFMGAYINQESGDEVEIIKKHVIEFEMQGRYQKWQCKMEQDETRIDHENEVIYRNDYKTAYDNEDFDYSYLKRRYYLQDAFYYIGTKIWAKRSGFEHYKIEPMSFIVLDTSVNCRRPLIYNSNGDHVERGLNGFEYRGRKYRGVLELIELVDWANENSIWNIDRTNYINKGLVPLKNFED